MLLLLLACAAPSPDKGGSSSVEEDTANVPDTTVTPVIDRRLVTYLDGPRFADVAALEDGSIVAVGSATTLGWAAEARTLDASAIQGWPASGAYGVIVHFSADLREIQSVRALPAGATEGLVRVVARGDDLWVSGLTTDDKSAGTGMFLARLPVDGAAFDWVFNTWAAGSHRTRQPWDVDQAGNLTYVSGEEFAYDWAAIYRLGPDGTLQPVEGWRTHWTESEELHYSPLSARPDLAVTHSGVVLKAWGRCDLRSWTEEDYSARTDDGNGGTRQGTWPMDLLYNAPCDPDEVDTSGPGYTGYSLGANPTQEVGAIEVDPATGTTWVGLSMQTTLPDGNPDFEPAVLAFGPDGTLLWWSRLYTESDDNSTPDQFVDALAYRDGVLYVVARAHGNNTTNLWSGDQVAATGASRSFHTRFTGTEGDIHISWIGRFDASSGQLQAASYLAEYPNGMSGAGAAYTDPNLDGWPDHDQGWPDLNTTRASDLEVDAEGNLWVSAIGRRVLTTAGAWQKMPKLEEGESAWSGFVRAYTPKLDNVLYSSLVAGAWDWSTGAGGDEVTLSAILPTTSGVLTVGSSAMSGAAMPTTEMPAWGQAEPAAGVVAHLTRD